MESCTHAGSRVYSAEDTDDDVHGKVAILMRETKQLDIERVYLSKQMVTVLVRWRGVPVVLRAGYFSHGGHAANEYYDVMGHLVNALNWDAEPFGMDANLEGLEDEEKYHFGDGEDERRDAMRQDLEARNMKVRAEASNAPTHQERRDAGEEDHRLHRLLRLRALCSP